MTHDIDDPRQEVHPDPDATCDLCGDEDVSWSIVSGPDGKWAHETCRLREVANELADRRDNGDRGTPELRALAAWLRLFADRVLAETNPEHGKGALHGATVR